MLVNFQFFKKMRNYNNSIDLTNSITKRNTMNYFHKLNRHKKTNTFSINDNCITHRSNLIDYLNIKFKNKSKESTRNSQYNSNNNDFINNSCSINDNNKKHYISIDENNNLQTNLQKIRKEKIFKKKKLLENLAQSQMISKNKSEQKNYLKITPSILRKKFITKIKKLKISKKVIKIVSCSVTGASQQINIVKINQDSYHVQREFLNLKDHFLLIISDGYGPTGHLISKYICNILPLKINGISNENINQSFILTKELLLKKSKIDLSQSGASFSIIIVTPEKIISSNIGTCKGVLVVNDNSYYTAINLTKDMKRGILSSDRRSMGGLDIPYTHTHFLKGNEKFILLSTNGLWEFINNDECVKIIKNYYENRMDANEALETIVRLVISRWKSEKNFVDDITCILLFFD